MSEEPDNPLYFGELIMGQGNSKWISSQLAFEQESGSGAAQKTAIFGHHSSASQRQDGVWYSSRGW